MGDEMAVSEGGMPENDDHLIVEETDELQEGVLDEENEMMIKVMGFAPTICPEKEDNRAVSHRLLKEVTAEDIPTEKAKAIRWMRGRIAIMLENQLNPDPFLGHLEARCGRNTLEEVCCADGFAGNSCNLFRKYSGPRPDKFLRLMNRYNSKWYDPYLRQRLSVSATNVTEELKKLPIVAGKRPEERVGEVKESFPENSDEHLYIEVLQCISALQESEKSESLDAAQLIFDQGVAKYGLGVMKYILNHKSLEGCVVVAKCFEKVQDLMRKQIAAAEEAESAEVISLGDEDSESGRPRKRDGKHRRRDGAAESSRNRRRSKDHRHRSKDRHRGKSRDSRTGSGHQKDKKFEEHRSKSRKDRPRDTKSGLSSRERIREKPFIKDHLLPLRQTPAYTQRLSRERSRTHASRDLDISNGQGRRSRSRRSRSPRAFMQSDDSWVRDRPVWSDDRRFEDQDPPWKRSRQNLDPFGGSDSFKSRLDSPLDGGRRFYSDNLDRSIPESAPRPRYDAERERSWSRRHSPFDEPLNGDREREARYPPWERESVWERDGSRPVSREESQGPMWNAEDSRPRWQSETSRPVWDREYSRPRYEKDASRLEWERGEGNDHRPAVEPVPRETNERKVWDRDRRNGQWERLERGQIRQSERKFRDCPNYDENSRGNFSGARDRPIKEEARDAYEQINSGPDQDSPDSDLTALLMQIKAHTEVKKEPQEPVIRSFNETNVPLKDSEIKSENDPGSAEVDPNVSDLPASRRPKVEPEFNREKTNWEPPKRTEFTAQSITERKDYVYGAVIQKGPNSDWTINFDIIDYEYRSRIITQDRRERKLDMAFLARSWTPFLCCHWREIKWRQAQRQKRELEERTRTLREQDAALREAERRAALSAQELLRAEQQVTASLLPLPAPQLPSMPPPAVMGFPAQPPPRMPILAPDSFRHPNSNLTGSYNANFSLQAVRQNLWTNLAQLRPQNTVPVRMDFSQLRPPVGHPHIPQPVRAPNPPMAVPRPNYPPDTQPAAPSISALAWRPPPSKKP